MKALVISDTHIKSIRELPRLDAAIQPYLGQVDVIFHAGDLVIPEVLETLRALRPVFAVAGNMDPPDLRLRLPRKLVTNLGRFRVGLTHGSGAPSGLESRVRREFSGDHLDCFIFGHSHHPHLGKMDGTLAVNPGSLFERRFAHSNTLAVITAVDTLEVEIVEVGEKL